VWEGWQCWAQFDCCVAKDVPLGPLCVGDHRGEFDNESIPFYMGSLHPRTKKIVADRLGQAAYTVAFGGGLTTGPVISGCTLGAQTLVLTFNSSLLRGSAMEVSQPPGVLPLSIETENTGLYLLVNASLPDDADLNHMQKGGACNARGAARARERAAA
jgi:hypothetical protein